MRLFHSRFGDIPYNRQKVQNTLSRLNYDFEQFELQHFIDHVAQFRNKPIQVIPVAFTPTLFGIWLPRERVDYLFYNDQVQPVLQIHTLLHEIAHMLLNHQLRPLHDVLSPEFLHQLNTDGEQGRLRSAPTPEMQNDPEEQESEAFVYAIQRTLMRLQRLNELTGESSSIPALKPITDSMGYTD